MKKLVLAASLFVAVAITAQQRRVEVKKDRVEYRQNQNELYGLGLSTSQERQIKSLETDLQKEDMKPESKAFLPRNSIRDIFRTRKMVARIEK